MAPKIEIREVETTYHETGVGQSDRVDKTYELGAVIDGKWASFGSVSESRLASLPDDKPADETADTTAAG